MRNRILSALVTTQSWTSLGTLVGCSQHSAAAHIPGAQLGALVRSENHLFQVIGFQDDLTYLSPLSPTTNLQRGEQLICTGETLQLKQVPQFGAFDPLGRPLDRWASYETGELALTLQPVEIHTRTRATQRFFSGVPALDRFVPLLRGQRLLLAAEAGVGKSTLLRMIAQHHTGNRVILALVGERGREAAEMIEHLRDSTELILIISTSDESPARRRLAATTATALAKHYAQRGEQVLLLLDSLTRYGRAIRDEALIRGELPARRGYPASVFTELPHLLEQPGSFANGSVTAVYTMLQTGELDEDPLLEEVRGILDGHAILRREIAERGVFPALSVAESLSRMEGEALAREEHTALISTRALFSRLMREKRLALFAAHLDPELRLLLNIEEELWSLLTATEQSLSAFMCSFRSREKSDIGLARDTP